MYREIVKDLIQWKDRPNRKPLLLSGVRQCGKTYIIGEFAREHFKSYAYVNFEETEKYSAISSIMAAPRSSSFISGSSSAAFLCSAAAFS